jgi:MipA family protein
LRGDYLNGAAFEDSPLLKKKLSVMGGIGISWIFTESKTRVERAR